MTRPDGAGVEFKRENGEIYSPLQNYLQFYEVLVFSESLESVAQVKPIGDVVTT
jgi:hypothetical protein